MNESTPIPPRPDLAKGPPAKPRGYQGIFESVIDLGDGFSAITLRAKRGKARIQLRLATADVKPELLGHFITMTAPVEEIPQP